MCVVLSQKSFFSQRGKSIINMNIGKKIGQKYENNMYMSFLRYETMNSSINLQHR